MENTLSIQSRIGTGRNPSASVAAAQIQIVIAAGAVSFSPESAEPLLMYIWRMIVKYTA